MALQAPERRERTLEEDLQHAFALSQADKRLGDYFPPLQNASHDWHFDGTEHVGGGFDSDMYAFRTRGQIKKEYEVGVVQWAREREAANDGWAAEEAARNIVKQNEDRKMKTIWAPEEADILDARREVERAWAQEQMEFEGLSSPKARKPVERPTMVDASKLSKSVTRPHLGEEKPSDRTSAWLSGRNQYAGIREFTTDPTEQNEIHTMDVYDEELRRRRMSQGQVRPQSSDGHMSPVRRPSIVSSSKPPSLPSKSAFGEKRTMSPEQETPRSLSQSINGEQERSVGSSDYTPHARRRSLRSIVSAAPSASIPPTLPSKNSGRGSPDSMQTESRQSARSIIDEPPESIHVRSPAREEHKSTKARSRPVSEVSRRVDSLKTLEQEPSPKERPISVQIMANDSLTDLSLLKKKNSYSTKKRDSYSMKTLERPPEEHIRSEVSSWLIAPPPDENEQLLDESAIYGPPGTSEPSVTTLVGAERLVSPASQIARAYRQAALEASADPTNSIYLREMPFTHPGMFSSSMLRVAEEASEASNHTPNTRREAYEEPASATPRQRPTSIPHSSRIPASSTRSVNPAANIDKSLPGTPYTTTHSVVSTPEFDADALESAQRTDASYYRDSRASLPPGYTSGSKTPRGSLYKSPGESLASMRQYGKSVDSLASARTEKTTQTSSTGAMGDAEQEEILNPVRGAERRPSKKSSKRHRKPEGSVASSDGSGSTVKASNHTRSQSAPSDDGRGPDILAERATVSRGPSGRSKRSRGDLPPGTSHTRIIHSDSDSANESPLPPLPQESPVHSSPLSVDISDEEAQYVAMPEATEPNAPGGRMSAHTFGLPTGTNMTFRDSRDWRASHDAHNDSKASLQSRPQSMAPSSRSNRTRASTLRASMRSPLPNISERDTNSELSFREDGLDESPSFGANLAGTHSHPSAETIPVDHEDDEQTPMDKYGIGPAWRAELWGSVAWDAAAARRSASNKPKPGLHKLLAADKVAGTGGSGNKSTEDVKSSSSSFGEELKDDFTMPHRPESYHGSVGQGLSSGVEEHTSSGHRAQGSSGDSRPHLHDVGTVVEWKEENEVGMAGVGAHGIRAKVSYKEPSLHGSDVQDE